MRDVKAMSGAIMCVLDGAEIAEQEIVDLAFNADGELLDALNEALPEICARSRTADQGQPLRSGSPDDWSTRSFA